MFYHREEETVVSFTQLETEMGRKITLTPFHLIPFGECSLIQKSVIVLLCIHFFPPLILLQHLQTSSFRLSLSEEGIEKAIASSRFAHRVREGDCLLSIGVDGSVKSDSVVKVLLFLTQLQCIFRGKKMYLMILSM